MRLIRTCTLLLLLGITMRTAPGQTSAAAATSTSMPMNMPMPAASAPASATAPVATDVQVSLSTDIEDGKKQLIATVKRSGKPVENATVPFGVTRFFGRLVLGADVTLDDGTAAVAFPGE